MVRRVFGMIAALALSGCSQQAEAPVAGIADPAPAFFPAQASTPAGMIAKGDRLASVLGCRGCHMPDLTGQVWEDEADFAVLYTSNLTLAAADYDDAELAREILAGWRPDGSALWEMPAEIFQHLGQADMAALLAFLRSLPPRGERHPRMVLGPDGRAEIEAGIFPSTPELVERDAALTPGEFGPENELGRYIVRVTCAECHGPTLGGQDDRPGLDIVANYTREEFAHLMVTGEPNTGATLGLMGEVARGRFSHFTDAERDAVYDYLIARANRD